MKRQRVRSAIQGLFIGLSGLLLVACGETEQRVPEMSERERQNIEAYTRTMRPVCIGRFQVGMPQQLALRHSSLKVNNAEISARPTSRAMFESFIRERKEALAATEPLDDQNLPFLKEVHKPDTDMVIMDRNDDRHTPDSARILEGYRWDGGTMFKVQLEAIDVDSERYRDQRQFRTTNKFDRLKQVKHLLNHLQPRRAGDIPEGPGLCLEDGFLVGEAEEPIPGAALQVREETVAMTFVDRQHPSVHVVFQVDNTIVENSTLLDRTDNAERLLKEDSNFSVLRRGKVDLQGIEQAEEWLITETTYLDIKGNYFNLEANSKSGSPEMPYIDISFRNGDFLHGEEHQAIEKAALTDAEAVGLWDAITRTFRTRPGAF